MITIGDLDKLLTEWKLKLAEPAEDYYDVAYKDAVNDCLYDLNSLIENLLEQEERAYTYMSEIGGN